jgi:hypothetical protein
MKRWILVFVLIAVMLTLSACDINDKNTNMDLSTTISTSKPATVGLAYELLLDGTYGVMAGTAIYADEIVIPSTYNGAVVTQIMPNGFENATNLVSVTIPSTVTSIGRSAFAGCTSLIMVVVPDSVSEIGPSAFKNCTALESITLPLNDNVFAGFFGAKTVDGKEMVTAINLKHVVISGTCTEITGFAFAFCSYIESITIPGSVNRICLHALAHCESLTSIYYNGTMAEWHSIQKDDGWDLSTGKYTVHCSDGDIKKAN